MELKEKILSEMLVDYKDALERNFELAKKFIGITREGKVVVKNKESFTGRERILLYLIGKVYVKEAGLIESEEVTNRELMDELGLVEGSVLPWTKELRDTNKIVAIKMGVHKIPTNLIEKTLKEIAVKVGDLNEQQEE